MKLRFLSSLTARRRGIFFLAALTVTVLPTRAFAQNAVSSAPSRVALAEFALAHPGDPERGRKIYAEDKRMICVRCHTTDGHGGKAGPDLAAIGDKFSRRELIRSILEPSAALAIGYSTTVVTTKYGEDYSGVLKQATTEWIELMGGDGRAQRILLADVKEQHTSAGSLMPDGLANALSPAEFSDLVAYLQSLHQQVDLQNHSPAMPEKIPQATQPVEFTPFFQGGIHFEHPVWFGVMPGFTNRFVVLELVGKVWLVERTSTGDARSLVADVSAGVHVGGGSGMLAFAFHPQFAANRKYYLTYQTMRDGRLISRLVERQFAADFKNDSGHDAREILAIPATTQDHTGGVLLFGPDGFLYYGMGDTGPQQDPQGHAQNLGLLTGKILRVDVNRSEGGLNYAIPRDNPFVGRTNARPEIWAWGVREPWRASFDPPTGDLWLGDVGQDQFEEITIPRAGENHGWNVFEGITPFSDRYRRAGEHFIPPVFTYSHRVGVSVTGGFVYRGQRAPLLYGHYICGDFEARRIWALTQTNRTLSGIVEIGRAPTRVVSFGQDAAGELCFVGFDDGVIYQLNLAAVNPAPRESKIIAATAEENPVLWRCTELAPTNGWQQAAFDDSTWKLAAAGFGTAGTPGAVVRSDWHSSDLWLRREFTCATLPTGELRLRIHHDEDVEVYLNGVEIARAPRWTSGYVELPLTTEAAKALRAGKNLLALHCHQNSGGQYVDAGLIESGAFQK